MNVDVLIGLQWGDEGKGKIVDFLAPKYQVIARFQGGPNAGHTLVVNGEKIVLHTIPSGILHKDKINLIGNGVVVNPSTLCEELDKLDKWNVSYADNLLIAERAHLILPTHKVLDAASEAAKGIAKIGSTLRGIGPAYMDKTGRNGLRIGDIHTPDFLEKYTKLKEKHLDLLRLYDFEFDIAEEEKTWFESIERIKSLKVVSCPYYLAEHIKKGHRILAEGAQGSMLDVDFGTYPFVTSSNTITAAACKGLGIGPNQIKDVIGISKAYCTRVGAGPFPTGQYNEIGEKLRVIGHEFGATTGRERGCGWIDLVALKYACIINGVTQIALTKADVLNDFDTIESGTSYTVNGKETKDVPFEMTDDMKVNYTSHKGWKQSLEGITEYKKVPKELSEYVSYLEDYLEAPITIVSTGPGREELILK